MLCVSESNRHVGPQQHIVTYQRSVPQIMNPNDELTRPKTEDDEESTDISVVLGANC